MRKLRRHSSARHYNVPGAYALEFTAAIRYEVFKNNNTNVAVPKFGMRWQPFDETFTVRATWGEGFREPSLIELYASPTSGLTVHQPISCRLRWAARRRRLGSQTAP